MKKKSAYCLILWVIFIAINFNVFIIQTEVFGAESSSSKGADIIFKAHNVGVGSLSSIVFSSMDGKKILIYDAGAKYYANELVYTQKIESITPDDETRSRSSSEESAHLEAGNKPFKEEFILSKLQEILPNYRKPSRKYQAIFTIQTLIISHPDEDHYNLAAPMLDRDNIHIQNIILSGAPWEYNDQFQNWIKKIIERSNRKTIVYCPAISFDPLGQWPEHDSTQLSAPHIFYDARTKAYQSDVDPHTISEIFGDALKFGSDFQVMPLSINPNHIFRMGGVFRFDTDKNTDSLVMKVVFGNQSILLTGDAVEESISNLLHLYKDTDFLKSTLLQVPHHGGYIKTLGKFLDSVMSPSTISLISHGNRNNHPRLETYNALRERSSTDFIRHNVFVVQDISDSSRSKYKPYIRHTNGQVLTTLTNGTITSTIFQDGRLKIMTEKDGELFFSGNNLPLPFDDVVEEIDVRDDEEKGIIEIIDQNKAKKEKLFPPPLNIDAVVKEINEQADSLLNIRYNLIKQDATRRTREINEEVCNDIRRFMEVMQRWSRKIKDPIDSDLPTDNNFERIKKYLIQIRQETERCISYKDGITEILEYKNILSNIIGTCDALMPSIPSLITEMLEKLKNINLNPKNSQEQDIAQQIYQDVNAFKHMADHLNSQIKDSYGELSDKPNQQRMQWYLNGIKEFAEERFKYKDGTEAFPEYKNTLSNIIENCDSFLRKIEEDSAKDSKRSEEESGKKRLKESKKGKKAGKGKEQEGTKKTKKKTES